MTLYHGTNVRFGCIDLGKCPPDRDFGQGFYLTKIRKHAQRRAQDKVKKEGGEATVFDYKFDLDLVIEEHSDLRVKRFEVSEEWARFVMFNRLRKPDEPTHDYDIVEGPVADDRMFQQFHRFRTNRIKLQKFVKALTYREATHQIAFCTERAIDLLLDYSDPPRYKMEETVSELSAALMQDQNLDLIEAMKTVYHSNVFETLTDYANKLYRKPWQEIYHMLQLELAGK
jgi:hypothetical protein